jgi:quercetin dioxygenase-like cupin family protein
MTRLTILAALATLSVQQSDPVVHMSKEPRHKVVFESGTIRVQDIQIPPGDTTLFHTHDHAVLYVPISSSRTRSQLLGGEWSGGEAAARATAGARGAASAAPDLGQPPRPGRVSSPASYIEKPMTHRVNNVGDSVFRLIAIGNLSQGTDATTDDLAGFADRPELLNRYYRAYRIALPAGNATTTHSHSWPVVIVQQTAGAVGMEGTDKVTRQAGQYIVHERGPHLLKNASDKPVELIEIEVRGGSTK